jgi:predicted Zn-dependent protease
MLGSSFSTSYAAKVYHWVDDKGRSHYSENPPRDMQSKTLNVKAAGAGSAGSSASTKTSSPAAKSKTTKTEEETSLIPDHSPEDKAKYCLQSQNLLQQMNGNTQRRFKQPDGSFRKLEQTEIADYQAQAREGIKNYCK